MSTKGQHCPFLNRADPRCSEAFNIERLDHAFKYCFGRYTSCPVYVEMLIERRVKQSAVNEVMEEAEDHARHRVIQVTVHRTSSGASAGAESVPALPGGGERTVR